MIASANQVTQERSQTAKLQHNQHSQPDSGRPILASTAAMVGHYYKAKVEVGVQVVER